MRDTFRAAVRRRVGRNVRDLRLRRGFTQEKLAELVGNTNKHIGSVERGETNVGIDVLATIAAKLSVDIKQLFSASPSEMIGPALYTLTERDFRLLEQTARVVERVRRAQRRRSRHEPD